MEKSKRPRGFDRREIIEAYESGLSVADIAQLYDCSETAVRYHLRGIPLCGKGGRVSMRIPANELHKTPAQEKVAMAEKNAVNACITLEKCALSLNGTVARYALYVNERVVGVSVHTANGEYADSVQIALDSIQNFIEELKAVCRCAQHYDTGNAMW